MKMPSLTATCLTMIPAEELFGIAKEKFNLNTRLVKANPCFGTKREVGRKE
jgi:hypothetical protein